jgi:tetratricopeptide (TPR) repeat protein
MKRWIGAVLCVAASMAAQAARIDVDALWNYSDPAASEARFRDALAGAQGDDALILRTQIARTLGLRKRFDDAERELDAVQAQVGQAGPEVAVRLALERGRGLRSSGRPADSVVWFERAFEQAHAARLERLAADALHMVALAVPTLDERIAWNRRTIDYARKASDPKARGWEAPALNNIGSDLREAGRLDESLAAFREALAAYERTGRAEGIRVARWQVANVLRLQGRHGEALSQQLALERDAAAAGQPDPYVYDELALLHAAGGNADAADRARARAKELRGGR